MRSVPCSNLSLQHKSGIKPLSTVKLTSMPTEAMPKGIADKRAARAVASSRLPPCKSSVTSSAAAVPVHVMPLALDWASGSYVTHRPLSPVQPHT